MEKLIVASNRSLTNAQAAVNRTQNSIFTESFVPWKFHPRNEIEKFEPPANGQPKTYIRKLEITQTTPDNPSTFKPLAGQADETYNLTITTDGAAVIAAVSSTGVLRALETFTQLFYLHSVSGAGVYCNIVPVNIRDGPKKPSFELSTPFLGTSLTASTSTTDGQSWPIDIPALPELSQKGAYQTGLSYTPQDIEDIQIYGIYRGVEVIIEIDIPGHTASVGFSHPELVAAFREESWHDYCGEPPCGSLKLNSTAVYDFITQLFNDLLPRVSPYSAYFHTGGDEIDIRDYVLDETVDSKGRPNADCLGGDAWEEMLLDWNLELGDDVVVQTWINSASLDKVTARGHKALFGSNDFWYLACGHGQWFNYDDDTYQAHYPFNDFCSPLKNWRLMYSYDPTAQLSAEQVALVLGGEVHLFTERSDPSNLDAIMWPRTGAAAEVMWSGRQDASGQNRSQIDAAVRLSDMRERMVIRGVSCEPIQMAYCTQYDGDCTW
ncbi:hypothetical protein V496_06343 [Pseudogymnoascus sp. VKM F-4515 (FW-2607)]|nr:hypothetical protein V496_06343 [Pseudogymnoascus sp. VKM F-4515 (FW-2607)]